MFTDSKKEEGREKCKCERKTSISCLPNTPQLRIEPVTQAYALQRPGERDDSPTAWATWPVLPSWASGHRSWGTLGFPSPKLILGALTHGFYHFHPL